MASIEGHKIVVEVKATELDVVRQLIECLKEHFNGLPKPVQEMLEKLSEQ